MRGHPALAIHAPDRDETPGGGVGVIQLQCPACQRALCDSQVCSGCGFHLSEVDGIFRALVPERKLALGQFIREYELVRAKEGRFCSSPDYYLELPFRDVTGSNSWQWGIRARTYQYLERHVLPTIESEHRHGADVLDVGAGNCWLSYRLALRGHRPVAIDLLDNDGDGMGAARHYFGPLQHTFERFQAEMDRLPFAAGQFDVAIFNASFHYSVDYEKTLEETLRCLRRPGHILILDSPLYWREESGRTMVEEKRAGFQQRYGFRSDSLASCEFLTPRVLDKLAARFGLQWKILKPWYGWAWALRPAKAWFLRRREPSKFFVVWGRIEK